MGTTLTGTTPQDTYDSLIKVTDNGPLSGSLKVLTDGLGNNSTLSLSTAAASIAGTLAVTGALSGSTATFSGQGQFNAVSTGAYLLLNAPTNGGTITMQAGGVSFADIGSELGNFGSGSATNLCVSARATRDLILGGGALKTMTITSAGNVGIGTTAPNRKLVVVSADSEQVILTSTNASNLCGTFLNPANTTFSAFIGATGNDAVIYNTGAERVRVTNNGLTFNGDTAAANALDDYEEGTWTMGVSFGGASVGVTTSANTGTYTKIGRQVTVNGYLALSSKGSSTGTALLTGLPFTIPNSQTNLSTASLWLNSVSFLNQHQAVGKTNSTSVEFWEITTLGAGTALTAADFANDSNVIINFTYFV